jgi:hypothetical protein
MVVYKIGVPDWVDFLLALPVLLYRKLRRGYTYRLIRLSQELYAKVDPEDFYKLIKYKWHARQSSRTYYANRIEVTKKQRKGISMHRFVMSEALKGYGVEMQVDHINGDGLDNRKVNLRLATAAQNSRNRRQCRGKSSKYKGVSFIKPKGKYVAEITCNGKRMSLGHFKSEVKAAKAYDEAAKKYHGEFACLNFPEMT